MTDCEPQTEPRRPPTASADRRRPHRRRGRRRSRRLLEQEGRDDLRLRVAVQPGGCSGLRYQLFFDERSLDGDIVTDFDGVEVVVDRMSAPYLAGATIDFADRIDAQGFTIDNPNAHELLRLRRLVPLSRLIRHGRRPIARAGRRPCGRSRLVVRGGYAVGSAVAAVRSRPRGPT